MPVPTRCTSYDDLLQERCAVYVALPHALHCEWTIRALPWTEQLDLGQVRQFSTYCADYAITALYFADVQSLGNDEDVAGLRLEWTRKTTAPVLCR